MRYEFERFMYKDGKLFEKPTVDYGAKYEEVHSDITIKDITFSKEELIKFLKVFGEHYIK